MLRHLPIGVAALLASAAGAQPRQHADQPGPDFDLVDFNVALTPDFATGNVAGRERIALRSLVDGLSEIRLSGNALAVVPAGGNIGAATRAGGEWVLRLRRPLRRGEQSRLTVVFSGRPARGITITPTLFYTTYFACDWMVCAQDRPGDKATVTLLLYLPVGMTSQGPGELRSVRPAGGLMAHEWRLDRPYSTYLFGFAAGRLQSARSRAGTVALEWLSDAAAPASIAAALAPTADMLQFFEGRAGVAFPHRRYAQLVVAGGEAQEEASHAVLGWDGLSGILTEPSEDWLIAHELAHQWWGNLVTCADWRDFWLNEGITTFMVAAWKEQRWGRAAYEREMMLARRRVANAAAAGIDVPLTFAGPYPNVTARRAITYSKAALFLDTLRSRMGDASFWAGLRRFTRAHAGGAATSRDFQAAMQAEAAESLDAIFREWVFG
jgi:aminopeptidase N